MTPNPSLAPSRFTACRANPAARVSRGNSHPIIGGHPATGDVGGAGGRKARPGHQARHGTKAKPGREAN